MDLRLLLESAQVDLPKIDIFSGIQPTGRLHLGNYLGAVQNWVRLQREKKTFFCIVDYHALTTGPSSEEMEARTLALTADLLSCGIDPERSALFAQSDLPEHLELYWILSCVTRFSELSRMTQFKEKGGGGRSVGLGLLNYPVLQAADILLYGAKEVPVGEDQIQHLEFTREILRRFNARYGPLFEEVEVLVTRAGRVLSLSDPSSKMSKSQPAGCLFLDEGEASLRRKIRRAVTDSGSEGSLSAGVDNLVRILESVDPSGGQAARKAARDGSLRYGDLKESVGRALQSVLEPIREERMRWEGRKGELEEILASGARRARDVARPRLGAIREAVGLPSCPR